MDSMVDSVTHPALPNGPTIAGYRLSPIDYDDALPILYMSEEYGSILEEEYCSVLQEAAQKDLEDTMMIQLDDKMINQLDHDDKMIHKLMLTEEQQILIEEVSIEDFFDDVSSLDKLCIVAGGRCDGW